MTDVSSEWQIEARGGEDPDEPVVAQFLKVVTAVGQETSKGNRELFNRAGKEELQ